MRSRRVSRRKVVPYFARGWTLSQMLEGCLKWCTDHKTTQKLSPRGCFSRGTAVTSSRGSHRSAVRDGSCPGVRQNEGSRCQSSRTAKGGPVGEDCRGWKAGELPTAEASQRCLFRHLFSGAVHRESHKAGWAVGIDLHGCCHQLPLPGR